MPSRGTGSSSNRPRRAKSTSSIKARQSLSTDPEIIDQHALTAAAIAFERAHGRMLAQKMNPGREATVTLNADRPPLARKQSVRFVGPTAVRARQRSITRREAPDYKSHVEQLQKEMLEEDYLDCEIASIPSSYKRLRKVKSMYSPRKSPSLQFSNGTPRTGFHSRSHSEQSSDGAFRLSQLPKVNLRRSLSFLRGKSDRSSSSAPQNATPDAAVQMARDQYLRQLQQERINTQPSVLTLSKRSKAQKVFRRTVRTSSTNSYGSAVASATSNSTEPFVGRGLGDKARNISCSLRNKLKKVFHRPSDTQEGMPAQQLDATRPHFGDYNATASGLEQRYEGIPSPDGETLRRVSSRESPLRNSPVILDRGSPAGSIRSARSDNSCSNGKSRVSSWTNSTATNTLSSRQKLERKRLSVIQENGGPHQSSSSVRHYGELNDGYNAFRKPIRNSSVAGRTRGLVDSQRIYSALQRRLGEKGRQGVDEQDSSTVNASDQARFHLSDLTPRRSSINSLRGTSDSHIAKNAEHSPDFLGGIKVSKSVVFKPLTTTDTDDVFSPTQDVSSQKTFGTQTGLAPQEVAQRNELEFPSSKRPLREVKSGFFPSNMRLERSKTSPFKRAMHTDSESDTNTEAEVQSPQQPRPTIYGFHNGSVTGSESVYSRTSSGNTPKPTESSLSLAKSENGVEAGTAYIITSQSGKYRESRRPFTQRNLSSAKSSGDWQNWMASQVATLESRGTENTRAYDTQSLHEIGHKRENAQLDGDDLALGKLPRPDNTAKQPLAVIHSNIANRPTLERKSSYSMIDRFPLLDIAPTSNVSTPKEVNLASTDLYTLQARPSPNVENERFPSSANRSNASSGGLRNKASSASLKSQLNISTMERYQAKGFSTDFPDSQGTPTPPDSQGKLRIKTKSKTPSRHSPERLARLRRMQSSVSPGLSSTGEARSDSAQPPNQEKSPGTRKSPLATPNFDESDTEGDLSGSTNDNTPVAGSQNMVDLFLSNRSWNMKSREASGSGIAFL